MLAGPWLSSRTPRAAFPRSAVPLQACYSYRRARLCVECHRPSRYVFTLLGCRLCEACEHQVGRDKDAVVEHAGATVGATEFDTFEGGRQSP